MKKKAIPDISKLNARLAKDSNRLNHLLDILAGRIEPMIRDTQAADWKSVSEMSGAIARESRIDGNRKLTECAERVRDEAAAAENPVAIKKSVIRLIGAIGAARPDSVKK